MHKLVCSYSVNSIVCIGAFVLILIFNELSWKGYGVWGLLSTVQTSCEKFTGQNQKGKDRRKVGGSLPLFAILDFTTIKKMVIWYSSASCEGTSVDSETLSPECFFSSSVCGVDCPSVLTPQVKMLHSPLG